jgi:hypothetical protein
MNDPSSFLLKSNIHDKNTCGCCSLKLSVNIFLSNFACLVLLIVHPSFVHAPFTVIYSRPPSSLLSTTPTFLKCPDHISILAHYSDLRYALLLYPAWHLLIGWQWCPLLGRIHVYPGAGAQPVGQACGGDL